MSSHVPPNSSTFWQKISPGTALAEVEVQRPPPEGHLPGAVAPARRAEQAAPDARAGAQLARGQQRRPRRRAAPVAARRAATVAGERVQRQALAVDDDAPVARLAHLDRGRRLGGARRRRRPEPEQRDDGHRGDPPQRGHAAAGSDAPIAQATPVPRRPAVAVGHLVQVLLVVGLGVEERAEVGDLGRDRGAARRGQRAAVPVARALGHRALVGAGDEDDRAVLGAAVVALPVALGGVVLLPERAQQLLVRDDAGSNATCTTSA
jgi:hypothetical protein